MKRLSPSPIFFFFSFSRLLLLLLILILLYPPRWFDINNYDIRHIVEDYASRSIPLDLFILDMDWHTKNDWTGYTFDARLFPYPADSMAWLKQKGGNVRGRDCVQRDDEKKICSRFDVLNLW